MFIGPTPSLEVIAAGAEVTRAGPRAWPLVEVVDRREDPPGAGFLSERTIAALRAVPRRAPLVCLHTRQGGGGVDALHTMPTGAEV